MKESNYIKHPHPYPLPSEGEGKEFVLNIFQGQAKGGKI